MAGCRTTSIAVAVVEHQGRVLIGRRPEDAPLGGYWEFPGGKIRPGETPEEAAARECLEETGLAVTIRASYGWAEYPYPHGQMRIAFLAATPGDPHRRPKEPFRWVALSELANYRFPPANQSVIGRLIQGMPPTGTDKTDSASGPADR